MVKSQLLEILRVLTPVQLKELKLFVRSPYYNRSTRAEYVQELYFYLHRQAPDFEITKVDKQNVYQQVFKDNAYDEANMDRTMSDLLKIVRQFIILESSKLNHHETEQLLHLAAFYRENGFYSKFEYTTQQLRKILDEHPVVDSYYYHWKYRLENEIHEYEMLFNQKKGSQANLPEVIRHLDLYYLTERLQLTTALLNISQYSTIDPNESLLIINALAPLLDSKEFLDVPIKHMYRKAMSIINDTDGSRKEDFLQLLNLLDEHSSMLPESHLKSLLACCRNYCTVQYNMGKQEYLPIQYDLYKKHLSGGYLYHEGGILPGTLQNLVILGLKMKDPDWVKQTLEEHQFKIVGTNKPDAVFNFNLANYYFFIKDHTQAIRLLAGTYEDTWYNLKARCLEMKIFFEDKEWSLLDSKADAFKIYILRLSKKYLSDTGKMPYLGFINIIRLMAQNVMVKDAAKTRKLIQKVQEIPQLAEREWCLEKLMTL